jgi:hypothetical protein
MNAEQRSLRFLLMVQWSPVALNADGKLWVEKFGMGKHHAGSLLPLQS